MAVAIYPGSFDPVTFGHLDIINRAASIFDHVIIGVLINQAKKPLFTIEERVDMLQECTKNYPNVSVVSFDGLLIDFARDQKANVIVRGLRAVSDFEYELVMAQTNRHLCPDVETIFLATEASHSFISSSSVRELALFQGEISQFVPPFVEKLVWEKMNHNI